MTNWLEEKTWRRIGVLSVYVDDRTYMCSWIGNDMERWFVAAGPDVKNLVDHKSLSFLAHASADYRVAVCDSKGEAEALASKLNGVYFFGWLP